MGRPYELACHHIQWAVTAKSNGADMDTEDAEQFRQRRQCGRVQGFVACPLEEELHFVGDLPAPDAEA